MNFKDTLEGKVWDALAITLGIVRDAEKVFWALKEVMNLMEKENKAKKNED